jgi:hypothetical protein
VRDRARLAARATSPRSECRSPCRFATFQQVVEATAVRVQQRLGQRRIDVPIGTGDGFGANALDAIQRRDHDVPVAKRVEDTGSQHDTLVRLQGPFGGGIDGLPVVCQAERFHAKVCAQLKQMLTAGLLSPGIL